VFPVSPWTLRAPDQLVRHLRPSVWLVLCGRTVSCEKNLCARQTEFIARMFFKWAFFKVKKARPAHVGKSNSFAKRGETGKVKKGKGGSDKRPPLHRPPSLEKVIRSWVGMAGKIKTKILQVGIKLAWPLLGFVGFQKREQLHATERGLFLFSGILRWMPSELMRRLSSLS
jgi:hypothetical protein